ncbi:hypothetical protein BS78_K179700 [Paspalum vaginatum]|uniref:Uncharacterized protein n=1 Tax=Paspalum vaginatum TaxID=158149 RepID=A0A9W8CGY0_9POAL|nr:hypothetical protein BS78_K179700 [Paspalum vaginatum]
MPPCRGESFSDYFTAFTFINLWRHGYAYFYHQITTNLFRVLRSHDG